MMNQSPVPGFETAERACAEALIALALKEDLGSLGDLTARVTIPADARGSARFVSRKPGRLAGLPVVSMLADRFSLHLEAEMDDGARLEPGSVMAHVQGSMRELLAFERTALNFLQRLSGVATLTARFVEAIRGSKGRILDTRKTTPGWRALEKYAVRCGGGHNHRIGLYDGILIKDNHLAWLESTGNPIREAIHSARSQAPDGTPVEIEVDTLNQLDMALACHPDIILVDNFDAQGLVEAVKRRDQQAPRVLLEASGGITLETVTALARTGVDRISIGALTHSAPALDVGLDFEEIEQP